MCNLLCCCFGSQPTPQPLPEWSKKFSQEVIEALGGEEEIAKFPVYERLFTLPKDRNHLLPDEHERMNTYLKNEKKNIGVFRIDQINTQNKTEATAYIIFIRVFDRQAEKAQFAMRGIYIEEKAVSFAFTEKSTQLVFREQTSFFRLEPVKALVRGDSLGTYNESESFTTCELSDSDPILSGHGGRVYLADSESLSLT